MTNQNIKEHQTVVERKYELKTKYEELVHKNIMEEINLMIKGNIYVGFRESRNK